MQAQYNYLYAGTTQTYETYNYFRSCSCAEMTGCGTYTASHVSDKIIINIYQLKKNIIFQPSLSANAQSYLNGCYSSCYQVAIG